MLDLSKLVCNPHHGTPPDRNRVAGYRRGFASLSVVKERLFRVHRNAPVGCFTVALDRRAVTPNQLARDLSGGTYLFALREFAFQLCFSSACAELLLRVLAALRLASEIPCGTSRHSSLATNHCRKIKNPASSAGYSHPHLSGSTRSSTSF